jgi:aspartyl-tRNA(Asn)/glutamyl-tRNA(Gln) amidotransferase subunit C
MPVDLDIEHIARLARIELAPAEKAAFAAHLADILAYVELLGQADVRGVEPMAHAFPVENVWGEDVPRPGLPAEAALGNAPAQRDGMFSVPRVVEE